MKFYQHRTVEEQANRLPRELREAYKNSQIDRIKIMSGDDTIDVTGYAEYSYLEEKSYVTQPVRTIEGKIEDLDEYATFLTPRLIIKYNMMGIDDYRMLMKALKTKNSFFVRLYDVVEDKIVIKKMYAAPTSMPVIYQQYLIAYGIQEFSIELIGTDGDDYCEFYINNSRYFTSVKSKWEDIAFKEIKSLMIIGNENIAEVDDEEALLHTANGKLVTKDDAIIPEHRYYTMA